jgi:predicted cupin superfamily sugar epimerase
VESAEYWIEHLNLRAHPEGGYYKETYRSAEQISTTALPDRFAGTRHISTAIFFLLRSSDRSLFHRIKSDELWHYHAGSALYIYVLKDELQVFTLGSNLRNGETLQVVVPANCWFGPQVARPNSYTLSGCTVAPGFDFNDFEIAKRDELLKTFPAHRDIIRALTI